MRLWIAAVGAVAALALVGGAGTASATVGYTPGSSSSSSSDFLWFVGRGDVISNFGKGALVPNLDVQSVYSLTNTVTCTYPDGAVRSFSGSWNFYIWGYAQPRYAPGNDQITGYLFGPGMGISMDDSGVQMTPGPRSGSPLAAQLRALGGATTRRFLGRQWTQERSRST
jgi:hypothetical protein